MESPSPNSKLKGMTKWLTISCMVAGAILMLLQDADAGAWFDAAGINVTIVTLFLFAPLFGIPVRIPDYVEALKRFYEANLRSMAGLFAGTSPYFAAMTIVTSALDLPWSSILGTEACRTGDNSTGEGCETG